jgi:hypothetical protein
VSPQVTVLADKVREGLDRADRLLEGLLALARAQHGTLAEPTTVSLPPIVAAALDDRSAAIAAKGVEVDLALGDVVIDGSEALLTRMVDNLVDNAVRHNVTGGWIRVETGMDSSVARLVVETSGRQLDDRDVHELTQPFRRLGTERTDTGNGTGLGLSIVDAIAAAHGGAVHLHARPQGGLRVDVVLPRVGT